MSRFKDHFSAAAVGYAAHRPTYPRELVEFLTSLAPSRSLAWDAGCGSGQLSVLLADCFDRVIATDASAAQIAEAEPRDNVEYRVAKAETGIDDGSVDLAVAAQAAHWFDLDAYYGEVRRCSKPGAILALITYGNMTIDPIIDAVIEPFYWEVLGPYWPPERRFVEEAYRSLPFPFAELTTPTGLAIRLQWDLDAACKYIETWSAMRGLEKAKGRAPFEEFRKKLAEAWGEGTREIAWPLAMKAAKL